MTTTTKQQLRDHLRTQLTNIPPTERAERSRAACQRAAQHPFLQAANTVLTYLTAANANDPAHPAELDTHHLNHLLHDAHKTLAAPRIDWGKHTMHPRLLHPDHPTETRRHHIPEPPASAPALPLDRIDLIILPGLAFDPQRNRLGRGAGFYDRFLATTRSLPNPPQTLALGFDLQLVERVPTDPHDLPADALVTESTTLP